MKTRWLQVGVRGILGLALGCLATWAPLASASNSPGHEALLVDGRRDLDRLLAGELEGDPDELYAEDPTLALQVMLLRAGREIPPTVSAARRAEREAARGEALAWLHGRREADPEFDAAWESVTTGLLLARGQEVLWTATARTLGRLGDTQHVDELGTALESPRPGVTQAARAALHDLYVDWFSDREAFEAFLIEAGSACEAPAFRERARELEREVRELSVRLLAHESQGAAAKLDDPDPFLRAAAARALASAGGGEGANGVDALLERLAVESDGAVFHALLEALLETQAGAPPDAPVLVAVRARLAEVIERGDALLQAPAAHALSRMTWAPRAPREERSSLLAGIGLLTRQVRQLSARGTFTDRDVLVTAFRALYQLGDLAEREQVDLAPVEGALRDVALAAIREEAEAQGVRVAAARLLAIVGRPTDIGLMVAVMNARGTSPEFSYMLLGLVGEMARGLKGADAAAPLVLDTLLSNLALGDPDQRRRALDYLADPELAELVRGADAARFVLSLGVETSPELQARLLELIAERGGPELVAPLLGLSNFDAIANSGPAGIARLVATLSRLAGDDPALLTRTAERLLQVENENSRVARLTEALALVARVNDADAARLPAADHDEIVAWARELREAGGSLPGEADFLRRLVDVHIPACSEGSGGRANLAHLQALFLSDLLSLDPEAGSSEQVLAHFAQALREAEEQGRSAEAILVRRDRARFELREGREDAALADYRAVFASALAAEGASQRAPVLDLSDLRGGGELLSTAASGLDGAQAAREALGVSVALLEREAWRAEPATVRVQDLLDLADRARRAGTLEALDQAAPFFAELPALPPAAPEGQPAAPLPEAPDGAAWAGLLVDSDVHATLLAEVSALASRRAELDQAEAPADVPEPTDEDSPEPAPDSPAESPPGP